MKLTLSASLIALSVSSIMSLAPSALAQEDALLSETQDILNSEQIDIDGTYRKETAADRIEKMRKKLEAQNEQMVQKKIEDIRIKQETELSNKLQKAFRGNLNAMDSDTVGTYQAAPQRVVAPMPVEEKKELKNKIIPFFGVKQFDGENIDSFEAKVNAGLSMENMITERLSVGLAVNYTAMDITDFGNNNNNGFNQFNIFFNDGDEISYNNVNIALNGKFFLTTDTKIRPYVGAGVGYNRTSLKFDEQNSQFNNFGNTASNEDSKVSGSNVTGTGAIGAEVLFTDSIGVNLEFNYTRAITSAFDQTNSFSNGIFNDRAKAALERLGDNLEESDVAALNIGFVVKF